MPDPNSERIGKTIRQHVRIEVQIGVRFIIAGDPAGTVYEAVTKNICRGGLCLISQQGKESLIAATRKTMPLLIVSLFIEGDENPIEVQTKTAWISSKVGWFVTPSVEGMPVLIGVEFEDLTAEDAEKIDLFIERCLLSDRDSELGIEEKILSRLKT